MDLQALVKYTYPTVYPDTHYCPICENKLSIVDDTTERTELKCSESCSVDTCFYNGTSKDVKVNMQTVHRYIEDMYSDDYDTIITKYYEDTLSDPFLESVLELIRKKDTHTFKQTQSGSRVAKYKDSFVRLNELLHYTVCFEDDDRVCVVEIPKRNAKRYTEGDVEQFVGVS